MKSKKVYVVPHSHWDREWYFTLEDSNVLLVENLDRLIEVLENDSDYHAFVFDAQMSVIEEYLKIRPENRQRLEKLVAAKRIFVGPWYTQTDSLLVNKESVIRNLLYGTKMATAFGHSMNNGYLPDIFGQNMYLPSIFKGFGIDYSILQRGIYTDQLQNDLNFVWKSPDGQSVKANNIYFGYGPGKFLAADEVYHKERLTPLLNSLVEMNQHSDHLLLPSGGDQVLVRTQFPQVVKQLNENDQQFEYILSDYETFMEDAWKDQDFTNVLEGELIATQKSRIHNTIRSQRIDLKQLNYQIENKILYHLEPLAVIGQTLGLKYPAVWLDQMWKQIFDVHAHDSIGGCNSDDTNRDIITRLVKVNRIADALLNIIKKQLTKAICNGLGQENVTVFFNTNVRAFTGVVEQVVFTKAAMFDIQTLTGEKLPIEMIEQEMLSGGKQIVVTAEGEKEVPVPGYYRTVVKMHVKDVAAMGYQTFIVNELVADMPAITVTADTSIENDLFKISFEHGQLTLSNQLSGQRIQNFIRFEDVADAGDSYDFSPLDGDLPIYFEKSRLVKVEKGSLVQKMVVETTTNIPTGLVDLKRSEELASFTVTTELTLNDGEEMVRVKHKINNTCMDHRLRVLLSTGISNVKQSFADQAFSIIERPVHAVRMASWRKQKFAEAPVPIYPLENFVAVSEANQTFSTITSALKEYEVLTESNELALTLFRGVGLLGRDDLSWRPGRASGINNKVVLTPDAQLLQALEFEYAVVLADQPLEAVTMFSLTDCYRNHYTSYQSQTLNSYEERLERFELPFPLQKVDSAQSLFSIDNAAIFASTCKRAYEADGVIIRFFNPTNDSQSFSLTSSVFTKQVETNLFEADLMENQGIWTIPAKGYMTLKLS